MNDRAPAASLNFGQLLSARARQQPAEWAFSYLADGEQEVERYTFAELARRAFSIGAHLRAAGVERALLLHAPGLEYVAALLGCMATGVVAVPGFHPARLSRTIPRLSMLLDDARPSAVLASSETCAIAQELAATTPELGEPRWLSPHELPTLTEGEWARFAERGARVSPAAPAVLQYTSGSTSAPRGVVLSHGNLLHNSAFIAHSFGHSQRSRGVIWLPPYHDMGLIGGILQPLFAGFPCVLMSPTAFLQRPIRWFRALSRYRGTTSGGPNFAYEACLERIKPEHCAGLDLSSWDVAFNGAEPIRPETLERFAHAFAPLGFRAGSFYPCYGLAEATLAVSGGKKGVPPAVRAFSAAAARERRVEPLPATTDAAAPGLTEPLRLVPCGAPAPDQEVRIIDPERLEPCDPREIGEIWVRGPSVAAGYWNRSELSRQTFGVHLPGGEGEFLRTGDLGFLSEGELFVTGRLKDVMIVRGRNYHPQDAELASWRSHAGLRPFAAAAFTLPAGGVERLIVVQEIAPEPPENLDEALSAIRRDVTLAMDLQVHTVVLVAPRGIPFTPSGKVQRALCRQRFQAGALERVASFSLTNDFELQHLGAAREMVP